MEGANRAQWGDMVGEPVAAWSPGGAQDSEGENGRYRYGLAARWTEARPWRYIVTDVQLVAGQECENGYRRVGMWANNGTSQMTLCERRDECVPGEGSYVSQLIAYTSEDEEVPETLNGATLIGKWGNAWGSAWSTYTRRARHGAVALYQTKSPCPTGPLPQFKALPGRRCQAEASSVDRSLNPLSGTIRPWLPCPDENNCMGKWGRLRGPMTLFECQWRCANTERCVAAQYHDPTGGCNLAYNCDIISQCIRQFGPGAGRVNNMFTLYTLDSEASMAAV